MAKPSITTRTAKGSPLTIAEMDGNLTNLRDGYIKIAVPGSRTQQYPSGMIENSTEQKKFGERSIKFNGTSHSFQSNHMGDMMMSPYNFGMSTFTIEMFIWVDSTGTGDRSIVEMRGMTSDNRLYAKLTSSNQVEVYRGTNQIASTTTPLPTNTWVHLAIERNSYWYMGTGGLYIFTNGAQNGSGWQNQMDSFDNTSQIIFGRDCNNQNYFKGFMDEIRVSKNFQRYIPGGPSQTLPFAVPTQEFSSDSNTVLLIHANDSSGLSDDIYSSFNLDLNDRLLIDKTSPATLSMDANNKRIYIGIDTGAISTPVFLAVQHANSLNHNGRAGRIDFGYNEIIDYQGFVSGMGNGVFQIQNNTNNGQNYLIELYGQATTTGTGQIELYNQSFQYTEGQTWNIDNSVIPFAAWQINVSGNTTRQYSIGIQNASGTETMTGRMWLKVTRV